MSLEDLPPSLSPEEAERLASKITPSWEAPPMDEETTSTEAAVVYQTPIVPAMHAETEPKLVAAEIRREAGAKIPIASDIPTSPRTPAEMASEDAKAKLAAAAEAADAAAAEAAEADATVRMPSITDGLSDGDIMAAEPLNIPGPPRAPAIGGRDPGPPPRKVPAPTGNMIPFVPEQDRDSRNAVTARRHAVEDEIPVSSIGGSSRNRVLAIVGAVALLAFGGVFFALRSSGETAKPDPSASTQTGMVQPASSKNGDVPAPEALPETTVPPVPHTPPAASPAEPKKPAAQATAATPANPSVPAAPPKPQPHVAAAPPPPKPPANGAKPATPPPSKPGGIVRDNPF